jgi:hypothetical protein
VRGIGRIGAAEESPARKRLDEWDSLQLAHGGSILDQIEDDGTELKL